MPTLKWTAAWNMDSPYDNAFPYDVRTEAEIEDEVTCYLEEIEDEEIERDLRADQRQ